MLVGHLDELNYLQNFYDREGSHILVVYGQKGVGKTSILKDFVKEKPHFYYACRNCSEREQQFQWGQDLADSGVRVLKFPTWQEVLSASCPDTSKKAVLVIDEFQYIIKGSESFMDAIVSMVGNTWSGKEVLIVLVSSSTSWVENSMVKKIGEAAYELSGLLKVRELEFFDIREAFPGYSMDDAICLYSILGGVPHLWQYMDPTLSLQKNICRQMLSSTGGLRHECERLLSEELRELGVYSSILSALACGHLKLNDIYNHTGFSRAKISVYLKNLMELEIIEKVFSYDSDGRDATQKGVYRISNHFVHFYFTYLYANMNKLELLGTEEFYKTCIKPYLRYYTAPYFKNVCMDYLLRRAKNDDLPISLKYYGEWVGKAGNIDIILQGEDEQTIVGLCNFEKPMFTYEDYEWLLFLASKAKIQTDFIWLFSSGRFDEKLYLEEIVKKNLKLISLEDIK